MKNDVTIVVAAYNEEQNLEDAVGSVTTAGRASKVDYRILIVDDGSTDATGKIAEKLAKKNKSIKVLHNRKNMGLGNAFRYALAHVETTYVTVFPGDNDLSGDSLCEVMKRIGEADLVTAYMIGKQRRTLARRIFSKSYVVLMNFLFGLNLRYFNGPFIVKTSAITSVPLRSNGLDIFAEAKVRMIKKGYSYKEITFEHMGRKHGVSTAVNLKSIIRTLKNTARLFWDMRRFLKRSHLGGTAKV